MLTGRGQESAAVSAFLAEALAHGGSLVLSGEPGIGKTVMLDDAAKAAEALGARVLRAAGAEFEADLSFSALHQVLLPLIPQLDRLEEDLRLTLLAALGYSSEEPGHRLLTSNAALQLLRRVADDGPVLVIVDDLQWCDRSSAAVLSFMARRLRDNRIAFLGARRSDASGFFHRSGLAELPLGPLDERSALELLQTWNPELAPGVRDRIARDAEGNPTALIELPSTLSGPQRGGAQPLPAVLPLPRGLQAVFEARIAGLPRRTRDLLLVIALGGSGDVRAVRDSMPSDHWLGDIEPAENQELLRVDEAAGRAQFRHPLVASAVVGLASGTQRRNAHSFLAECLSDQPDRQAWHLAEAATGPDERVASLLERVANQSLRRGDSSGAVATMTKAAQLSPDGTMMAGRFAQAAYIGLHFSGEIGSVPEILAGARQSDPGSPASLYAAAASAFMLVNEDFDVDSAHRLLTGALEAYGDYTSPRDEAVASALHTLIAICIFSGRAELWEPVEALIAQVPLKPVQGLRLMVQLGGDLVRNAVRELPNLKAAIAQLAGEIDDLEVVRICYAALYVDRIQACRMPLRRRFDELPEADVNVFRSTLAAFQCHDDFLSGRWQRAGRQADQNRESCRAAGARWVGQAFAYYAALLAAACGDGPALGSALDELCSLGDLSQIRDPYWEVLHVRGLAALARRDYEEAYQCAAGINPAGSFAPYARFAPWVMLDLVEAAVHTGRISEARAHVDAIRSADLAALSPRMALLCRASEALAASGESASVLFRAALSTAGAENTPFDFARVQLLYGEHLRRERAVSEARQTLSAAAETFGRLGARPWLERTETEIRATGISRARGSAPPSARLTSQEYEIAALAASGLSNKEIGQRLYMSPRTVGAHLYRIFPKLGITSRAALRDALDRLPPAETQG